MIELGAMKRPSMTYVASRVAGRVRLACLLIIFAALSFGASCARRTQSHDATVGSASFDHAAFDRLLRQHVDEDGWVDYRSFAGDEPALDQYLAAVAAAPLDRLGRDGKLALLINAYNAATIKLILDHFPVASIRDIPASQRWKARRWVVGGKTLSLDGIEHQEIRPRFAEPRIHFALVCAAVGCPPLLLEAFVAERLEEQLEQQATYVHRHPTWVLWDPATNTLALTPLYEWYDGDFERAAGSVAGFAARYVPGLRPTSAPRIRWLDYDWSLNDVANRRAR